MKKIIFAAFAFLPFVAFTQAPESVHTYKVMPRIKYTAILAEMPADTVPAFILDNGVIVEGYVVKHAVKCVHDPYGSNEGQIFTTQQVEFFALEGREIDPDKVLGWFEKPEPEILPWYESIQYKGMTLDSLEYGKIRLN